MHFPLLLLALILACFSVAFAQQCNQTLFEEWSSERYTGTLATDPTFWRYQKNDFFVLTKGLAADIAVTKCTTGFSNLFTFAAGRSGPVLIQDAYKVMCSDSCLESDALHEAAMAFSGCSCRELSVEADNYCLQNSARLLCETTGFCGIWNCRVDDFMCPRYEFNKKQIFLKGFGHCVRRKGAAGAKDAMVYGAAPSTRQAGLFTMSSVVLVVSAAVALCL